MLEPADKAPSKCAVRKDVWVRIPPAAPVPEILEFDCRASPPDVTLCADRRDLGETYAYLLGMYLGDGYLTLAPKAVWRLRVVLDARYPLILDRCAAAMTAISGRVTGRARKVGCFELYSNWKHWLCVFPQHGVGAKHTRPILLDEWQRELVSAFPAEFVRGLIHSDGCRAVNRVKRTWLGQTRQYSYPRYFFSNNSPEIRGLFLEACGAIGVEARHNNRYSISVARRRSVAVLEALVGPKR